MIDKVKVNNISDLDHKSLKIIAKDNFGRETVDDIIIAENLNYIYYALLVLGCLKDSETLNVDKVYYLAEKDYKIYKSDY